MRKIKILFLCYDGKGTAAASLPYRFSEILKMRNVNSEVLSYKDHLGARYHGPESYKTSLIERLSLTLKAMTRLMHENNETTIVVQKAGFHSLSALFASFFKGNKIALYYDDYEFYDNRLRDVFFYLMLRRSRKIFAASKSLQEFLRTKTRKPIYYIPPGADIPEKTRRRKIGKSVIFTWLGIVMDEDVVRNIYFILDAFDKISSKNENVYLHIRASGPLVWKIQYKIKEKKLHNVKIIEWVDDINEFLMGTDVGLFPLVNNNQFNRSKSPTKVFQYMAAGLPVVCSDIGEASHLIKDGVNGFLAHNTEEFSEKMLKLANSSALRKRIGAEGFKTASGEYSRETSAMKLFSHLKT